MKILHLDLQIRKCKRLVASRRSKHNIGIIGTPLYINDIIGRGYLLEPFRQIRTYFPEPFRQIRTYFLEPFRQIRSYLPEPFRQIRSYLPEPQCALFTCFYCLQVPCRFDRSNIILINNVLLID